MAGTSSYGYVENSNLARHSGALFNPSTQEAEAGGFLEVSLVCRVSARTIQRNRVLGKKLKKIRYTIIAGDWVPNVV